MNTVAASKAAEPKMAHVNLMVDTMVANLPEDGLRSVLRSMLATDPSITPVFEERTKDYLRKSPISQNDSLPSNHETGHKAIEQLPKLQQKVRVMLGCGMCFESVCLLTKIVSEKSLQSVPMPQDMFEMFSSVDGDIIQALTAIQKTLLLPSGSRQFSADESIILKGLLDSLRKCQVFWQKSLGVDFIYDRGLSALESLIKGYSPYIRHVEAIKSNQAQVTIPSLPLSIETFSINGIVLPRLFSGLWQLSSPSWRMGSLSKVQQQFLNHAAYGFTAYDMADHYGDAEITFGKFRASCTNPVAIFGATKYCIFTPTDISRAVVQANVTERCRRMASDHIDLLQFHWQFYDDKQYIQALRFLQEDSRVRMVGLCNFDTQRMSEIIDAGVKIYTNQVQFSLIDSRPVFKMGSLCQEHDIKLLTYGTLCGGFLSEKWFDNPEPEDLFANDITPSQRKYYEMILNWGGWTLFQELLTTLKSVATKHNVSIPNVASRWVLDFPYVGAVIVGTRMGVSDNAEENLKTYGWKLDENDQVKIESVLKKSKRDKMIDMLGDCGGEYR